MALQAAETFKYKSADYFNKNAESFSDGVGGTWMVKMHRAIAERLANLEGESVLDIGCGGGQLLGLILGQREFEAAGLDISAEMIELARRRLGRSVDLRTGDAEQLPWERNSFDLITCTFSFHHYPQPAKALAEMRRVIRPGGRLILGEPNLPVPLRQLFNLLLPLSPSGDVRFYGRQELDKMLSQKGFYVEDWQRVNWWDCYLTALAVK